MCMECRQTPCHPQCPNYTPLKTNYYCSICEDGIYEDDQYVENMLEENAHLDCLQGLTTKELIKWFGFDIKTMR